MTRCVLSNRARRAYRLSIGQCANCATQAITKHFCAFHLAIHRERSRKNRHIAKAKVFDHYGNFCTCCGETAPYFLTIDHIDNDGAKHRRELAGRGDYIYSWIVRNKFPTNLQVLCMNCNYAKRIVKGDCPCKGWVMPLPPSVCFAASKIQIPVRKSDAA